MNELKEWLEEWKDQFFWATHKTPENFNDWLMIKNVSRKNAQI